MEHPYSTNSGLIIDSNMLIRLIKLTNLKLFRGQNAISPLGPGSVPYWLTAYSIQSSLLLLFVNKVIDVFSAARMSSTPLHEYPVREGATMSLIMIFSTQRPLPRLDKGSAMEHRVHI